jgi:iron complex outermembrane receptor protein
MWVNRPDRFAGFFAQQEWPLGRKWEVNVGGRFDCSWLNRNSFSPRAAMIYKISPKTDFKLLYGRGFSSPSNYVMFFDDNGLTQKPNPALKPETTNTFEFDAESRFTRKIRGVASIYRYEVNDLIQQIYTSSGLEQYINADIVRASGASFELDWQLPAGTELRSSLEMQRAVFGNRVVLPNSPGQVGKFQFLIPLFRNRMTLGTGLQALGQRQTYGGETLPWTILPEAVVTTKPMPGGLQFTAGIKNLSNSFYRDPAGLVNLVDSMTGRGRSYYVSLEWRRDEAAATKTGASSSNRP